MRVLAASRVCAVAALALLCAVAAANPLRGLSEEDAQYYQGPTFHCHSDQKEIEISAINDDFCDCADGSDEPGTSACPAGRFYCVNKGFKGKYVPSSRVNDGVCDCCDGSDEWSATSATCADECEAAGAVWREETRAEIDKHTRGADIRDEWAKQGQTGRDARLADVDTLRADKERVQREVDAAQSAKEAAEATETAEREALIAEERARREAAKAAEAEAAAEATTPAPVPVPVPEGEEGAAEGGEQAEEKTEEVEEEEEEEVTVDYKSDEAEAARVAYNKVKSELDAVANKLKKEEDKLYVDVGPASEFYPLQGQCIKLEDREYEYELCPFDVVYQIQSNGARTTLGRWGDWAGSTYTAQSYTNGEKCWNGPERSIKIDLVCGVENALLRVDEPERCEYHGVFATPAACSREHAQYLLLSLQE